MAKVTKRAKLARFLAVIDQAPGHSRGWKWNREEIQRHAQRDGFSQ